MTEHTVIVAVYALRCDACGARIEFEPEEVDAFAAWWSSHLRPEVELRMEGSA